MIFIFTGLNLLDHIQSLELEVLTVPLSTNLAVNLVNDIYVKLFFKICFHLFGPSFYTKDTLTINGSYSTTLGFFLSLSLTPSVSCILSNHYYNTHMTKESEIHYLVHLLHKLGKYNLASVVRDMQLGFSSVLYCHSNTQFTEQYVLLINYQHSCSWLIKPNTPPSASAPTT